MNGYRARLFRSVVRHALPHRHLAGWFGDFLGGWCEMRGTTAASFTHAYAAEHRGRLHRNTSRDMLAELEELGLVKRWAYWPGRNNRYMIRWDRVTAYARKYDVRPVAAGGAESRRRVRTKADWHAERAAHRERQRWAREATEAERRAARARADQLAREHTASPEDKLAAEDEFMAANPNHPWSRRLRRMRRERAYQQR